MKDFFFYLLVHLGGVFGREGRRGRGSGSAVVVAGRWNGVDRATHVIVAL